MYGPRPIRFSAHWCADYSKYWGFLAGGISTASSLLPFFRNTAPPPKLQSRTHTIPPATQAIVNTEPVFVLTGFDCIIVIVIVLTVVSTGQEW